MHFRWLREYDLPGVFLQRFTVNLDDDSMRDFRDTVARNVRTASESHGRVFAVMYDISGHRPETLVEDVQRDWTHVVDTLRLLESPRYLRHAGRPVLAIWGFGFTDRPASPQQAARLIEFFKNNPDPRYRVTLFGGIPVGWRTLTRDSQADPAWAAVYRAFDVISPWAVGRFRDSAGIERFYADSVAADLQETRELGIEYMPVVFPGFSWHNMNPSAAINQIPRRGGRFFWEQIDRAIETGAGMLYGAMFDEVDESTAMFKLARSPRDAPADPATVTLDADGLEVPSDWYLRLAREGQWRLQRLRMIDPIPLDAHAAGTRRVLSRWKTVAFAAAAAAALVAWLTLQNRREEAGGGLRAGRTTRITSEPGLEIDPVLSPDGQTLAYSAGPPGRTRIQLRQLANGRTRSLTEGGLAGGERWPQWSADGTLIVFQAGSTQLEGETSASSSRLYVVPSVGRRAAAGVRVHVPFSRVRSGVVSEPEGCRVLGRQRHLRGGGGRERNATPPGAGERSALTPVVPGRALARVRGGWRSVHLRRTEFRQRLEQPARRPPGRKRGDDRRHRRERDGHQSAMAARQPHAAVHRQPPWSPRHLPAAGQPEGHQDPTRCHNVSAPAPTRTRCRSRRTAGCSSTRPTHRARTSGRSRSRPRAWHRWPTRHS